MPASIVSSNNSISSTESKGQQPTPLARTLYLKIFIGGCFATILMIFAVFSIYWGALWKIPVHNLNGWIVDFDGGQIGRQVQQGLLSPNPASRITWTVMPSTMFANTEEVADAVLDEQAWVAITINPGTSQRLSAALASPNATYDGTDAVTVFAAEARQENGFRALIQPSVQASLGALSMQFALQLTKQMASNGNLASIATTSPQTLVAPVAYRLINLIPFNQPVATAVTFVGLIYQLILSFYIVMIGANARQISGIETQLSTRSLILLRLASSFAAYFVLSLFYSLLSLAFALHVTTNYGHAGFLVFWMLNFVGMLAVGMALEAMVTLLTVRFIAFFMLIWIIANVSVCFYPIEVMAHLFRYGYAAPFYNVSRAMRTIVFGTKNNVGMNFGILIAWAVLSCCTLSIFQVLVNRRAARAASRAAPGPAAEPAPISESKQVA